MSLIDYMFYTIGFNFLPNREYIDYVAIYENILLNSLLTGHI
jgi:hypothetical protein